MQPDAVSTDSLQEESDRAFERRSFFLMSVLTTAEHGELAAKVRNLSAGGMMAEVPELPDADILAGQKITAELRNIGRVKGAVAWVEGRRFGIRFDRDIDPELARKPIGVGEGTPDYVKPVLVPNRSLRYVDSLKGR